MGTLPQSAIDSVLSGVNLRVFRRRPVIDPTRVVLRDGRSEGGTDYREELSRLGWRRDQLAAGRKGDPGKLVMAARLRYETTLSIKGIAAWVHLGTTKSR